MQQNPQQLPSRNGLSLIEVLVVLGIIGLLMALVLPAVMWSREAARKTECASHLRQIGIALANYESQWNAFPHGFSFKYDLLPYLERQEVYDARGPFDPNDPWAAWRPIDSAVIVPYYCPSDSAPRLVLKQGRSNYQGCYGSGVLRDGYNGIFNINTPRSPARWPTLSPIRTVDIVDGMSNTVAVSEVLCGIADMNAVLRVLWNTPDAYDENNVDGLANFCERIPPNPVSFGYLGNSWSRGVPWHGGSYGHGLYNHVLPPNRPSCLNQTHHATGAMTAASSHSGGVNVLYADGHLTFVSDSIDRAVWRELGSRVSSVVVSP